MKTYKVTYVDLKIEDKKKQGKLVLNVRANDEYKAGRVFMQKHKGYRIVKISELKED